MEPVTVTLMAVFSNRVRYEKQAYSISEPHTMSSTDDASGWNCTKFGTRDNQNNDYHILILH